MPLVGITLTEYCFEIYLCIRLVNIRRETLRLNCCRVKKNITKYNGINTHGHNAVFISLKVSKRSENMPLSKQCRTFIGNLEEREYGSITVGGNI